MNYIAYYRVSTQKQGQSGLGLEAQKAEIKKYIENVNGNLVGEFTDIESGSKKNRNGFNEAIELCKKQNCTLIAFRLDRLLRSLSILVDLRTHKINFTALDCLNDSKMIIDIKAAFAEEELRKVSERTINALKSLKVKFGTTHHRKGTQNNLNLENRQKGQDAIKAKAASNQNTLRAKNYAKTLKEQGLTLQAIADRLNSEGHHSSEGKQYHRTSVNRLLK